MRRVKEQMRAAGFAKAPPDTFGVKPAKIVLSLDHEIGFLHLGGHVETACDLAALAAMTGGGGFERGVYGERYRAAETGAVVHETSSLDKRAPL